MASTEYASLQSSVVRHQSLAGNVVHRELRTGDWGAPD